MLSWRKLMGMEPSICEKSGGKQPAAPDYIGAAREQGTQNLEAIRTGANLNRVNQTNPYGSTTYTNNGGDQWSQNTTLSPEQQKILDAQEKNQIDLGGIANQRLQQVNAQDPLTPYDPGDFGAQRNQVTDAQYKARTQYLDPQFAQGEEALRSRLLNSGIREGSEAYNNEMGNFDRQKQAAYSDASNQAVLSGGSEQSRLLADALRGRQQQVSEREIPLQEFMSMYGGQAAPGAQSPAVPQAGTPQPGDYQGAVDSQYGAQADQYNLNQQRNAQNTSSALNLAALAAMYYNSDRRLKTDIDPIGELPNGLPVYRYRFKGEDQIRMGVMADEVRERFPDAVRKGENGFDQVNYAAIGAAHLVEGA